MVPLTIEEMINTAGPMATLPATYMKLCEILEHPLSSARDIAHVISDDTALTARLLQLANSALFNFPKRIDTIDAAISLMGTVQLRDLTLVTAVVEMFQHIPQDLVNMESFWQHSLACGICARALAKQRHETNVEKYFAAGLLHDIGSMLLYLKQGELSRRVLARVQETGEQLYQVEREIFDYDHATIGAVLLDHWNLPDSHVEAVGFHHAPLKSRLVPIDAAMLHVADIITFSLQLGTNGEKNVPALCPPAWDSLRLETTNIQAAIEELEIQFAEIDGQMKKWADKR